MEKIMNQAEALGDCNRLNDKSMWSRIAIDIAHHSREEHVSYSLHCPLVLNSQTLRNESQGAYGMKPCRFRPDIVANYKIPICQ